MHHTKEIQALEAIREEMDKLPGHVGLYYKNLVTGAEYIVRGDESYLAASVIKLPVFLHVLKQAAEGTISLEQRLNVTQEDKLPSCGALSLFTGNVDVDIHTLCRLMICLSDNTATNKLIRFCTIEGLNESFNAMGMEKTILRRVLFDSESSRRGIQNYICPQEMGMLLEQLHRETFVSPEVSREAIGVLRRQQINHKMNGKVCGEVKMAHKTGEDDQLSNDVGIVYAKEPFVVCWAGHDTDVYRWEDLIRRGTYELYRAQE